MYVLLEVFQHSLGGSTEIALFSFTNLFAISMAGGNTLNIATLRWFMHLIGVGFFKVLDRLFSQCGNRYASRVFLKLGHLDHGRAIALFSRGPLDGLLSAHMLLPRFCRSCLYKRMIARASSKRITAGCAAFEGNRASHSNSFFDPIVPPTQNYWRRGISFLWDHRGIVASA